MTALPRQLRLAVRALRRNPGFTLGTILVLAIGIGANAAMFSLVEGILLRPLPYRDADRLVLVTEVIPDLSDLYPSIPVNAGHFVAFRDRAETLQEVAALESATLNLTGAGDPERLGAARVSWSLFAMLGVQPRLGRAFLPEEDAPGRERVAILSESLWRRRFGADPGVLNRAIQLDGTPHTVVGVLPQSFRLARGDQLHPLVTFEDRTDVWVPIAFTSEQIASQVEWNYGVIARLAPDVTRERAHAEVEAMLRELARSFPEPLELRARLVPLREALVGDSRRGLLVLLAGVAAVLLVACVNVANLLLVRATVRRRDTAIRLALGVTRGGLVRHALTESLLLAAAGGALGVTLAALVTGALARWAPRDLPRIEEVGLHAGMLAFALAVTVGTGLVFGLLPAWRASRTDPQAALRQGGRGSTGGGSRLRAGLVAAEVGLSAVLLVAAGLLLRSYLQIGGVEKGFETERVLAADVTLAEAQYPQDARVIGFYQQVLERLRRLPGVISVGAVSTLPLEGETNVSPASAEGTTEPLLERPIANWRNVSTGYFRTLGIPLLEGEAPSDDPSDRLTTVVSEDLARALWPGESAIGRRVRNGDDEAPLLEVVGVAGDVRTVGLDREPVLMAYTPYWQDGAARELSLVVRTTLPPEDLAPAVRREIRHVDRDVPVPRIRTLDEIVAGSVAQRRFQMQLVGLFGVGALLLATLGIFGVVSYAVAQRRQELGIRIALGATARQVRRAVLLQGMRPVALGAAGGLLASLAVTRLIEGMLFGVRPLDPVTLATVPALLLAVAACACLVPAARATRVDPMLTLRAE